MVNDDVFPWRISVYDNSTEKLCEFSIISILFGSKWLSNSYLTSWYPPVGNLIDFIDPITECSNTGFLFAPLNDVTTPCALVYSLEEGIKDFMVVNQFIYKIVFKKEMS